MDLLRLESEHIHVIVCWMLLQAFAPHGFLIVHGKYVYSTLALGKEREIVKEETALLRKEKEAVCCYVHVYIYIYTCICIYMYKLYNDAYNCMYIHVYTICTSTLPRLRPLQESSILVHHSVVYMELFPLILSVLYRGSTVHVYREFRLSSPPLGALSQFHAWWHVFAGMGTYLHIAGRYAISLLLLSP